MVHLAFTLRALLHVSQVLVNGCLLVGCGELLYEVTLRSQHHERHAEHRIGTGGEDGKVLVRVGHLELYLCTFRTANPVALRLLQRVGPVNGVETVQQTLGVCRHTQAPLAHLLLFHRIAAALRHTVHHLVVGQHRTQGRTPVDHRLCQVGNAVVHQHLLLLLFREASPVRGREVQLLRSQGTAILSTHQFEVLNELDDGLCLLRRKAIVRLEHTLEGPLRPLVVAGVAGAYLTVPVERETYLVQLRAVTVDVLERCLFRVLTCLDGVLLSRQSVGVVAHGVQHVIALQPLVAGIDVAGNVAERVSHMQTGTTGVREHVEHVIFLFLRVLHYAIGTVLHPSLLPFLFNVSEVVFHCYFVVMLFLF